MNHFINILIFSLHLVFLKKLCSSTDITKQVFGNVPEGVVAAFGDFNSDELTDVFIIRNKSRTLEILLGADTEPLLKSGPKCHFKDLHIVSVVPGDFDGDAYMDVLILTKTKKKLDYERHRRTFDVYINWGGSDYLNCTNETDDPFITTYGEPIAIDYNRDMIIDLFGLSETKNRTFWIFNSLRKPPDTHWMKSPHEANIVVPHAHAYLDLNLDFMADLFLQSSRFYEIWHGHEHDDAEKFIYHDKIDLPIGNNEIHIGQTIFLDMELKGVQNQILPVCFDSHCNNSTIVVYSGNNFHDLRVNFKDPQGIAWGFVVPNEDEIYSKTITIRGGDFNMDGYPDLLVTLASLQNLKKTQTFLLENVPCTTICNPLVRTFEIKWNALAPMGNNTVAGAFYDFYQDGVLDVILIERTGSDSYRPLAFRNTLDYDANFVKVIVLTGLVNKKNATTLTPLGRKKRTYGTNLPGPRIVYFTTTQEGDAQHGSSAQLPQSAYFSLQLPYTIFGLGRTPNFVDSLTVGLANKSRTWTQLIPNSQMIVVPKPLTDPQLWKAQLFVTPSKLILMSVVALSATCFVILLIILGLYLKEKKEDKQERQQEAHRFHFDAM